MYSSNWFKTIKVKKKKAKNKKGRKEKTKMHALIIEEIEEIKIIKHKRRNESRKLIQVIVKIYCYNRVIEKEKQSKTSKRERGKTIKINNSCRRNNMNHPLYSKIEVRS